MSLYLDVVCTESGATSFERQEKAVRVIGEILPYVLAKYGVANQLPDRTATSPAITREMRDASVRRLSF